jgi:hypothetical protein
MNFQQYTPMIDALPGINVIIFTDQVADVRYKDDFRNICWFAKLNGQYYGNTTSLMSKNESTRGIFEQTEMAKNNALSTLEKLGVTEGIQVYELNIIHDLKNPG